MYGELRTARKGFDGLAKQTSNHKFAVGRLSTLHHTGPGLTDSIFALLFRQMALGGDMVSRLFVSETALSSSTRV